MSNTHPETSTRAAISTLACAALIAAAGIASASASAPAIPAQAELAPIIKELDARFFALMFNGCDPATMRSLVSADLEFYHDKGGFVYRSGEEMVLDYAKKCKERQAPNAWRSRRELVAASLHIDPVPGYGAMQAGEHLFYERQGEGAETLVGRARFAAVWRFEDGRWKLARVLSYAHGPAQR